MSNINVNGNNYSDDGTAARDMRNGGHRKWLLPMLSDAMADMVAKITTALGYSNAAASSATAAAASASSALTAPGTSATSATSLAIGTGSKTLTIQTGKSLSVGQAVLIANTAAPATNWMWGQITAYNSGTGSLTVSVTDTGGSGTLAAWTVSLSATPKSINPLLLSGGTMTGAITLAANPTANLHAAPKQYVDAAAYAAASINYSARTSNTLLGAADKGDLVDITSGTFTQTFDACATLGNGWYCYIRNSGTGDITLDPNASELIDGLTSYVMYPGEVRLVQCNGAALRTVVLNAFARVFTASTSFVKPPGYSAFDVLLAGGGGGGGGGAKNTGSSSAYGGGGGGGAGIAQAVISSSAVASSETVTIGAGGVSGAGASTAGSGSNGGGGGSTVFGAHLAAAGGGGGVAGSTATYGGGGAGGSAIVGFIATPGTAGGAGSSDGVSTQIMAVTGGGGGATATSGTGKSGGASGSGYAATTVAGGGVSASGNFANLRRGATGGGGATGSTSVTPVSGGNGIYGSGGGGGGGANGTAPSSGSGGAGGDGYVHVMGVI